MPAKYSHVKKRPAAPPKKTGSSSRAHKDNGKPSPHMDRNLSPIQPSVAQLERTIARILLIRYEQDMIRLFSTHLYSVALLHLPTFVLRCVTVGGPSWVAANSECDDIKDFLRAIIAMDIRQAGDRVATKSALWTYTALRHFVSSRPTALVYIATIESTRIQAKSNGVPICPRSGLHSALLLPHHDALKAHLASLEAQHPPPFAKPPHLGPMSDGIRVLEETCKTKYRRDAEWCRRFRESYDRACRTLWQVAQEFDVCGYGNVLRAKLTSKWCDCGCSTEHLGEVCEKTVRMEEEERSVRFGKEREWDGRGSGVPGWDTEDEEDMWGVDLELASMEFEGNADKERDMTVAELIEWRYFRAEREKEEGNTAFKKGDFNEAIERYQRAYHIESELPHYQLNLAAAYLKINDYVEAEKACDLALSQHRSVKGFWRRAQARKAQERIEDALEDLQAVLRLQPSNSEAIAEIMALCPPEDSIAHEHASCSAFVFGSSQPSSSSAKTPLIPSVYTSWIPNSKLPEPLPFPRSTMDSRKLKISSLPVTIEVPAACPLFTNEDGKGNTNTMPPQSAFAGRTVPHTFTYPCWERYMVQKVSD
ncbi:hypothetical protein BC628DRAFT_1345478 [Trametes gibbosa]|nr:hypothetical protein BC628DRAFT_1345478 [Trametes gibbosa]